MKTKIAAALVTLACVASIGFPAAADEDASTARTRSTATAQPIQPRPETSGRFDILNDVTAEALSSLTLDTIHGAYIFSYYGKTTGVTGGDGLTQRYMVGPGLFSTTPEVVF